MTESTRIKAIRAALREKYGSGNYRITSTGEVHVYGRMPNAIAIGWYLFGYTSRMHELELYLDMTTTQ